MVLPLLQRSSLRGVQQITKPWAAIGSLRLVRISNEYWIYFPSIWPISRLM